MGEEDNTYFKCFLNRFSPISEHCEKNKHWGKKYLLCGPLQNMFASPWNNVHKNNMKKCKILKKKGNMSLLHSPRLNPSFVPLPKILSKLRQMLIISDTWNTGIGRIYEFLRIESLLSSQMKLWNSWNHTFACEAATCKIYIHVSLHAETRKMASTHQFLWNEKPRGAIGTWNKLKDQNNRVNSLALLFPGCTNFTSLSLFLDLHIHLTSFWAQI